MHSSNSIFFTRNSQLIKKAQASYYVDQIGKPLKSPLILTSGNIKYYYMSNGDIMDAEKNTVLKNDFNVKNNAERYKLNNPKEFTNGVPNFGEKQNLKKEDLSQSQSSAILQRVNEERKSYGLPPYSNISEMVQEENRLKREYQAAMQIYQERYGIDESQFIKLFPTTTAFAAEIQSRYKNAPINKAEHTDEYILNAIKAHDQQKLDEIEPADVMRVLHAFIKRLPKFDPRRQTMESYIATLRDTYLPEHNFTNPLAIKYIINQKIREAESIMMRSGSGMSEAIRERQNLENQINQQRARSPRVIRST